MAARIALVTDSTCNIPPELAAERHIYVAPLYVVWGDHSYRDGIDLSDVELFQRLATASDIPKTSQVSPQDFATLFVEARAAESADEIVCAVVSSGLSGTYASAIQARDMVDFPVHVIDTRQVSWSLGFPVLAGADARDAGAGPDEIIQAIRDSAARTRLLFTIESLEYLHRGGRIGAASRLLGSALNIKPVLELNDGIVTPVDKVRTRRRAVERLLQVGEQWVAGRPVARLAVIHANVEQEGRALLDTALSQFRPREHYLSFPTAVLGVHIGPGALGLICEWVD